MKTKLLGLIGYPLSHSFSKEYFTTKFRKERTPEFVYENFQIKDITKVETLIRMLPALVGLNVTIPHKKAIITHLDLLDETTIETGAANTLCIFRKENNMLIKGYNTDTYSFEKSIQKLIHKKENLKALILGTGGVSSAVAWVLKNKNIPYRLVSRTKKKDFLLYNEINGQILEEYKLIINTSPLGMYPETDQFPPLPYEFINSSHILFDMIYNPEETQFLLKGKNHGAITKNGLEMLYFQADKSLEIWKGMEVADNEIFN